MFTSRKLKLSEHLQWKKLLYYAPTWLFRDRSVVDSPSFFLAPSGKYDLKAELEATLRAFFSRDTTDPNDHPQCLFPARYRWLKEVLKFDPMQLSHRHCPRIRKIEAAVNSDRVSLVFSSGYLNNPASMFGHTFLRFHRAGTNNNEDASLLDHAVSYAADPTTGFIFSYAALGLLGGFDGKFSMTPYYLKVQEYNNAERRDLWEYELDLSPEEVRRMVLSVFEVGRHRITYFYFDDNCAYILMSILDVGRPTLNLAEEFKFWVTPAQTVRAVQSKRGLVKHLGYRASSFTRFQSRFLALNDQEGKILGEIFSAADGEPLPKTLLAASSECQTRVLDAALEYVDYRERLAGTKIAVTHAKLRKELLNARAKTEIPSPSFTYVDYSKRPDQGHGPLRLGMGISSNPDRPIGLTAEFRPVLHDLSALALGYSSELEIKFFDIKLGMDLIERSLRLDHFTLFEVMSLPSVRPMLTPISWHLDIGALSIPRCVGGDSRCTEKFLQGGAGLTYRFFKDRLGIYALGMASMGTGTQEGWYFAPGLLTGILARLDESVKFHTSLLVLEHLLGVKATDIRWKTELAWAISSFSELRPVALLANGAAEFGISSYWYF